MELKKGYLKQKQQTAAFNTITDGMETLSSESSIGLAYLNINVKSICRSQEDIIV